MSLVESEIDPAVPPHLTFAMRIKETMLESIKYIMVLCAVLMLSHCTWNPTVSISASKIPVNAWRPGDIAVVKRPLIFDSMEETSWISNPPDKMYEHINKPISPYTYAGLIRPGDKLKVLRVEKDILPNSLGGTRPMALVLTGEQKGRVGQITVGNTLGIFASGEYFTTIDKDCFDVMHEN